MRKFISNALQIFVILFVLVLIGFVLYTVYVAATT